MTPDACLIILFAVLALAGYLVWVTDRLPRGRVPIGVLALVTLVLAIVFHDIEVSNVASRAEIAADRPTEAGGTGG
jgi:hypothetical protein